MMTTTSADEAHLMQLVTSDPGPPRPDGTIPYWLHTLHPLAAHQSPALLQTAEVAVIGSGITGVTLVKTLLENDPKIRVIVLEARTICSGATGRNGGHLVTYGGANYTRLKKVHGKEMATKIIEFTFRTIRRTRAFLEESSEAATASQFRTVQRIRTFGDLASLDEARQSVTEFVKDNPQYDGMYTFIDDQKILREQYGVHGVVGAMLFDAGALWPYRFVMELWSRLLKTYSSRLSLEAQTPVTTVTHNRESKSAVPYEITTPRGKIRTRDVAYCTNGYTGHLIPNIRGCIYPFQGTMTVQDLNSDPELHNQGASRSWSIHHRPVRSQESPDVISGMYYLQQNAISGYYFFGGGEPQPANAITGNDTEVLTPMVNHLRTKLSEFLGQRSADKNRLVSSWSGIMGFTSDDNPLVGQLPQSITNRGGNGEWIAAGFNGMGMSLCVSSAEALAYMILGQRVGDWFPEVFNVTAKRLQSTLNAKKSVEGLKLLYPTETQRVPPFTTKIPRL